MPNKTYILQCTTRRVVAEERGGRAGTCACKTQRALGERSEGTDGGEGESEDSEVRVKKR